MRAYRRQQRVARSQRGASPLDLATKTTWDQTPVLPPEAYKYVASENIYTPWSRSEDEARYEAQLIEDDFPITVVDKLPTVSTEQLMSVVNTGRKKVFA